MSKHVEKALLFIVVFAYFKPEIISSLPNLYLLDSLLVVIQLLVLVLMIFYLTVSRKNLFDPFILLYLFLSAYLFIITLVNNGDYRLFSIYYGLPFAMILLIKIYANKLPYLVSTIDMVLKILITLNLISILLYPDGLYGDRRWILGLSNVHIPYLLLSLFIVVYMDLEKSNRIKFTTWVYIGLMYISLLLVWSATSLLSFSILLIGIFVYRGFFHFRKVMNIKVYTVGALITFVLLVYYRINFYFGFLIEDILNKDITLTRRTYIWDEVLVYIKTDKYMGTGVTNPDDMLNVFGYIHSHNYYLELIRIGGLVSLVTFMLLFIIIDRKINYNKPQMFLLSLFPLAILMLFQAEVYIYMIPIYSILYMLYRIGLSDKTW